MIDIEMVKIPGGTFLMGSPDNDPNTCEDEYPQHLVAIPSFWMSSTPITEEQWLFIAGFSVQSRMLSKSPSKNGYKYPVVNVKWEEAVEFCKRLSIHKNKNYRLPSEAEWEYACRAGTTTKYSFGDTITENQANFYRMGKENKLMPVGQFPPNAFGLYDMHGNVWEWCQDNWHDDYNGAPTDGSAWLGDNKNHVLRGGSWHNRPRNCHSAYRYFYPHIKLIGFRVVCSSI